MQRFVFTLAVVLCIITMSHGFVAAESTDTQKTDSGQSDPTKAMPPLSWTLSVTDTWTVGIVAFTLLAITIVLFTPVLWALYWTGIYGPAIRLTEVADRFANWVTPANRTEIQRQIDNLNDLVECQTLPASELNKKHLQRESQKLVDQLLISSFDEQYRRLSLEFLAQSSHQKGIPCAVPYFAAVEPSKQFCSISLSKASLKKPKVEIDWYQPSMPKAIDSLRPSLKHSLESIKLSVRAMMMSATICGLAGLFFVGCSWSSISISGILLLLAIGICAGALLIIGLILLEVSADSSEKKYRAPFAEFIPPAVTERIGTWQEHGAQVCLFFAPDIWREDRKDTDKPVSPTGNGFVVGLYFAGVWWLVAEVFPQKLSKPAELSEL